MSIINLWVLPLLLLLGVGSARKEQVDSPLGSLVAANRTELPLRFKYDTLYNTVTPIISVKVNGVASDLIFDTGSSGLRILKGALKGANVKLDAKRLTYGYGSAISTTYIKGQEASGTISVGGLSSDGLLTMMLIDTITHSSSNLVTPTMDSVALKKVFNGLSGVFGVGMRHGPRSDIASPLAQLPGNHSYLIYFPRYGQLAGKLVVNPTASDLTGFTFFSLAPGPNLMPNGLNSWIDNRLNGILVVDGRLIQATAILDTGNPITQAFVPNLASYGKLAKGTVVTLGIGLPGQTTPLVDTTFQVTRQIAGRDRIVTNASTPEKAYLAFGTNFFFMFDVYYDQEGGRIGIRKK
ncbi:hypothetical protein [Spirosoma lituiforme]